MIGNELHEVMGRGEVKGLPIVLEDWYNKRTKVLCRIY